MVFVYSSQNKHTKLYRYFVSEIGEWIFLVVVIRKQAIIINPALDEDCCQICCGILDKKCFGIEEESIR